MGSWARLVHPEIDPKDYPVIDITLENVTKTAKGAIVYGNACANVTLVNCRAEQGPRAGRAGRDEDVRRGEVTILRE